MTTESSREGSKTMDDNSDLPEGKYCEDCMGFQECYAMNFASMNATSCYWNPSRFIPASDANSVHRAESQEEERPIFSLHKLQDEQRSWVKHNFGDRPPWQPLLGAVEELGELSHAHLKQAQGIRAGEDHIANAQDAVADIVIFLSDYCSARGWDFESLIETTWDKVKKRDWKADPENAAQGEKTGE